MRDGKCHISFEVLAIKISNISKHKKKKLYLYNVKIWFLPLTYNKWHAIPTSNFIDS